MLLVGAAMAVSVLAAAGVALAQDAGTTVSPVLNQTPDEAWMTNGIVYSIIRHGDYVYVGGKFTRVQSAPGGQSFKATNLARFDAETGVGDPTWTPDVTGADMTVTRVYALAAAGGNIYVGGKFEAVDGLVRRNLAAASVETGVVDPAVDPLVGSGTDKGVQTLLASGSKVYLGGFFTTIDGVQRRYLGALDHSGNLDKTWKPKTDGQVRSFGSSCDGNSVFASGKFRKAAGSTDGPNYSPRETIARFDAASGALQPWAIPAGSVPNEEIGADLTVACDPTQPTVENQISVGYLGRNFVRSFDGSSGAKVWEKKCAGDVQTVAMLGPDKLIIGGHFSQVDSQRRIRIAQLNLSDGSVDPAWAPSIEGDGTAAFVWGPWDLFVDGNHLYVGGGFKKIDSLTKTNFARFTAS